MTRDAVQSSAPRPSDDRGAILIIGLLGCVLLFGIAWTVLGIGESIAFRERGQTAADAVAFSASVMQARGMNFLVFLNLIMAAIMVVRVALRVLEVGLAFVAIFTFGASLAFIPEVEEALTTANEFINPAVFGLGLASQAVQQMAPSFAEGTANYVAKNYAPVVTQASITSDVTPPADQPPIGEGELVGLPVQPDTTGYALCAHAVDTVFGALEDLLNQIPAVGPVISKFLSLIQPEVSAIIGAGAPFFCQLGVNLNPPDLPPADKVLSAATAECVKEYPQPTPGSPDYQAKMKQWEADKQACVNKNEGLYATATGIAVGQASGAAQSAVGLEPPQSMGLQNGWTNGGSRTIAIATLDTGQLRGGLTLLGAPAASSLPLATQFAFSESEFYYDCSGPFGGTDCDGIKVKLVSLFGNDLSVGGGDAMWNFRWRARLVPVNDTSGVFALYKTLKSDYTNALHQRGDPSVIQSVDPPDDPQDYMIH